jgi:hypothetical protein
MGRGYKKTFAEKKTQMTERSEQWHGYHGMGCYLLMT